MSQENSTWYAGQASTSAHRERAGPRLQKVTVCHYTSRSHSGVELELEQDWAYWMRNGRIWRMEQHESKQAALEAAGLSE